MATWISLVLQLNVRCAQREGEELDMMLQKILCFLTTSKDDMALSVLVHVLSVLEGIKMATFGAQKI